MAAEPQGVVLITGANQGVGFECAKNLVRSSSTYHVILGSRSLANGDAAVSEIRALSDCKGTVSTVQLDACWEPSVTAAVAYVTSTHGRLDNLVNNTTIGERERQDPRHVHLRDRLETNTIGPVLVTESFLPLLRKSQHPRLVFVSSRVCSLSRTADANSPCYAPKVGNYRASKAALNMLMIEYHLLLNEDGFITHGVDPGLVVTEFMDVNEDYLRSIGAPAADVGGGTIAAVVKGERDSDSGRVVSRYGINPW